MAFMKIAAVQMVSTPDVARNLEAAARLVAQAAAAGASLVALPEYFCLLGRLDTDKLAIAETAGDSVAGPIQAFLAETARRHQLWLVGGTMPVHAGPSAAETSAAAQGPMHNTTHNPASATFRPNVDNDSLTRVFNRCAVYGPDGRLAAHYDKVHLFAFDNGKENYNEGRSLRAGTQPVALQAGVLRLGLSVCYDLRFPELYRALMHPPCDVLCVPSAFTHTTGRAHWEVLLRARAIENQCYVLAPAQGGLHENGRRTWGHSMVIDPWGEVLAVCVEGEGLAVAELDLARMAQVRSQLPALAHRRL